MARKTETVITLTDDLDGTKADRTISFALEGSFYEIELSRKNQTALEKALKPYIEAARKVRKAGRTRTASPSARTRSRTDLAEIREWARANDVEVSDRGRLSVEVTEAYDAAH